MIYIQVGRICFQYNLSPHLKFGNKYVCSDLLRLVDISRGCTVIQLLGTLLFRGSFGFDIAFNSSASLIYLEAVCHHSVSL